MANTSYWDVLEPHWEEFCEGLPGRGSGADLVAQFPDDVGVLLATHLVQSEVRNGGFDQLFHNATGKLAPEALSGFQRIGMPLTAGSLRTAMARLGDPYPSARTARLARRKAVRAEAVAGLSEAPDWLWTPYDEEESVFYAEIDRENGGFSEAADAFCAQRSLGV